MTCSYCGSRNGEEEHRCRRCGRRPGDTLSESAMHRTDGALATQLRPSETAVAELEPPPATLRPVPALRPRQGHLFPDRSSNVIAFDQYAPARPAPRKPKASTVVTGEATARPAAKPATRRKFVSEDQGTLDFLPAAPLQPRMLGSTAEAFIYCEAPVATTLHRAVAAALDWSMVLIAYGLFFLIATQAGAFSWNNTSLLLLVAVLPILGLTYALVWAIANTETAGMRWAGLRLSTFDGFPPEPRQRLLRLFGSCLSLGTVLGWAWSLVDEEALTWQDHISKTFPTPRGADTQILQRG